MPPIAFAILFGLSMDYEVFLMSRIREEHIHGEDTVSRRQGRHGGRRPRDPRRRADHVDRVLLVPAQPDRVSKEFGLLLGVAILTDAIIIRLTLVPRSAHAPRRALVGDPRWLDKALPNVTIEPPGQGQEAARHPARREPAAATD